MNNLSNLAKLASAAIAKGDGEAVLTLKVEDVVSKAQVRTVFKNIEELGANIAQDGQHHPIVVFPKGKDGKYVIQKGERRWRAVKAAGLKTIKAIVNTAILDDLDKVAGELGENIHRDDLTSFEIADGLQIFIDSGWSQADIAKRINKPRPYVSQHLSLKRIPDAVRALLTPEICDDTTTLHMVAQIQELDPVICRQLADAAKLNKGLPRVEARRVLDILKDRANGGAGSPSTADDLSPTGPASASGEASAGTSSDDSRLSQLPLSEEEQKAAIARSASQSPAAQKPTTDTTVATKRSDAHTRPGAVTTVPGEVRVPPKGSTYSFVSPAQIAVVCSVKVLRVARTGELCLDRVDNESNFVWVKLYDEDGKPHTKEADAEYVSVPAADVKVIGTRSRA